MSTEEFLRDYNNLSDDLKTKVSDVIQELANYALSNNIKNKSFEAKYTIKEAEYRIGYVNPHDNRDADNIPKYKFLESHHLIELSSQQGFQYYLTVVALDTQLLLEINEAIRTGKITHKSNPDYQDEDIEIELRLIYKAEPTSAIYLNGIRIHKFQVSSDSDNMMQYLFEHQEERITYEKLKEERYIEKSFDDFLKDIKMLGSLKALFFPHTNNKEIYFRPIVKVKIQQ